MKTDIIRKYGAATTCFGYQDNGVMIALASDDIWNGGAACGTLYSVACTDVSGACASDAQPVVVQIVDYCPQDCSTTLVLSFEAFSSIADPDAEVISIYYEKYVSLITSHSITLWSFFSYMHLTVQIENLKSVSLRKKGHRSSDRRIEGGTQAADDFVLVSGSSKLTNHRWFVRHAEFQALNNTLMKRELG